MSGRLSKWLHKKKGRHSPNNPPPSTGSSDLTTNKFSIAQKPSESPNSILVVQPVLSLDIFPESTTRKLKLNHLKIGQRIEDIAQLVRCARLLRTLAPSTSLSPPTSILVSNRSSLTPTMTQGDADWLRIVENKPVEQDRIQQLVIGIVSEFMSDPIKDPDAIREIVLVGPVLERAHFRSLLTCFVAEFQSDPLLVVEKLQGLTQLVQEAPPGFLEADDLINILDAISKRLQGTASQSLDFSFHLTLAISKVLAVMADQSVEDLDRVLLHDPLGKALSGLESHDNPFLRYQAIYGSQALLWVPNDESKLQQSLRLFAGMARGLAKVSSVIQLDLNGFLGGLKDIQHAVLETAGIVKAGLDDFNAMIESGQELAECLKNAFGSNQKALWYISLRAAQELVRQGQLSDFNKLVCEAPSNRGYSFQWGICQLLGDIAVDPSWEKDTRGQSFIFLSEIFATTTHGNIRRWILTILNYISTAPALDPCFDAAVEEAIKTRALATIANLDKRTDEEPFLFPYLLGQLLPLPKVSAMLKRVNKTADLEPKLLKVQSEICEGGLEIYIPLMTKPSLQDSEDKVDPLDDRVMSFLKDMKEIMLILGDSGSGKSTYNRHLERKLWVEYQPGGAIPLLIDLKAMGRLDENDIVKRKLGLYGFTETDIQELKEYRRVILICDGYDECRQWVHLHSRVKEERWRSFQIIVACRIQYLTPTYRNYFLPRPAANQSVSQASSLFEEAVVVPFKSNQIEAFIDQFRETGEVKETFGDLPVWSTETYKRNLFNLTELVKNPFMLKLALVTLPSIVRSNNNLPKVTMTRFSLFDAFIKQHLEREVQRLGDQRMKMSEAEGLALEAIEDDFVVHGIHFSMRLAHAVFAEQEGVNAIEYSATDSRGWKAQFFGPKATLEVKMLRQSCQLVSYTASEAIPSSSNRSVGLKKTVFSFIHRSILEFFYSCRLCDFVEDLHDLDLSCDRPRYSDLSICLDPNSDMSLLVAHPLNQRSIVSESSIVNFLVEHANANLQFKEQLHTIVNLSKTHPDVSQASANSMTILVHAGVQFNGVNLQGIRIPGADLSGGHFDFAQLQDVDMTGVNLTKTWLRQADLSNSLMNSVKFSERPYVHVPSARTMALSSDKQALALGFDTGDITVLDTTDWSCRHTLRGHTGRVRSVAFSGTGSQIASGSADKSIRVWNLQDDTDFFALGGHTLEVTSVAFSPDGQQLVSGSEDMTLRIWNLASKTSTFVLTGHTATIWTIAWSPDGQQIASGGEDKTLRLWYASHGSLERGMILPAMIWSLLYFPHGPYLLSGTDEDVFIWDLSTDCNPRVLKGHSSVVCSLAISPDGQCIASASSDASAKIWSEQTGQLVNTFNGHFTGLLGVAFLNNREAISISVDQTLRTWEQSKGIEHKETVQKQVHIGPVLIAVYSPDGKSILSGSMDETIREWDAESGYPGAVFKGPQMIDQLEYSSDGNRLAAASFPDTLLILDRVSAADRSASMQSVGSVTTFSYSPCGRWLATGDERGGLKLWDLESGAELCTLEGHTAHIRGVAFAPNGQLLASWSVDNTVRFWDMSKDVRNSMQTGILDVFIQFLVFSPCGTMIAWSKYDSNSTNDKSPDIHLWDVRSQQEHFILKGHKDSVWSLAWSPGWIVSGGFDKTVRIWRSRSIESTSATWTCVAVIEKTISAATYLAWNPAVPLEFICGSFDSSLTVWNVIEKDNGEVDVRLKWGKTDRLMALGANITGVIGLDDLQRKLLLQGGAIDEEEAVLETPKMEGDESEDIESQA